ncbi:MAG TPA: polysaccharide biosynthesis tyrosine autokinase [Planctomycetes bacterium]|nr:polysaccharide biosynthesis tyrosine autokinase [Planctomycetota bacterium]
MQEPTVVYHEPEKQSTTHMVHVLMQFALAVRYRKHVLLVTLLVAALLGALYYATATRYYAARASLLVQHSGSDITETSLRPEGNRNQGLMPTFEKLVTEKKVLKRAIQKLTRPEDRVDFAEVPPEKWAEVLERNLSARTYQNTNVIKIEYRSRDPDAAVAVVNAVLDSYLEFMEQTQKGTASRVLEVFELQLDQGRAQMVAVETALRQAREEVGAFAEDGQAGVTHPVLKTAMEFTQELITLQKRRGDLEATLIEVRQAVGRGENPLQYLFDVQEVVGKEMMLAGLGLSELDASRQAMLERELLDAQAQMKKIQAHLGPSHPDYQATRERIRELEGYLDNFHTRVVERLAQIQEHQLGPLLVDMLQKKLELTRRRESLLRRQCEEAQRAATHLTSRLEEIRNLQRQMDQLWAQQDWLLQQIEDIRLKREGADMRAVVVTEPERIDQPVSPSLRRVVLMVLIAGLGTGLLAVYVLDILDDRFRSAEEMQAQLRAPVLAMVRQLAPATGSGLECLQVYAHPDAAESEAFRTLRTALSLTDPPAQRVVVSSAEPGDGKTTVLANLAVSYAQSDKRTLLIDADLRRPGLTALLGLKGFQGLSTVLRSDRDVGELAAAHIRPSGLEGLDVLPSGPRPSNPAELLASPRLADLLAWAESVYDRVLVDSPPALAASDTAIIGRLVDGAMLVVQPEKNRRRLVMRAAESLTSLKINLLGVVINRLAPDKDGGYYGYDAGYDYQYAGQPDGLDETDGPPGGHPSLVAENTLAGHTCGQPDSSPPGIVPQRRVG